MNFIPLYPEIFLLLATCAILLIDMFLADSKRNLTYVLSILTLFGCAGLTLATANTEGSTYVSNSMFVSDPMATLLKLFSYLAIGVTLVYSRQYVADRGITTGKLGGEFYVLALFSLLGQMLMISGNNFLIIYLGLEMMSLSLYALVALRREHTVSTEAAMKYFILGALASGFMLYGISMLYGATGSLELSEVARVAASPVANKTILVFGLVFLVAGLAFKLGVVPFHMWVPDVYQGSPTAVTLLLGSAPKLAAFAITFRFLVEGLFSQAFDWQQMLLVLAVLSMAVGNLTAIAQTNLKRMLAYSTIAQMGFMLLGLATGVSQGNVSLAADAYSASMFYSITYVMSTLGTFGVILLLSRAGFEAENLDDLKGLNKRSPWFAFVMLLLMFSLAGIPPLMGFYAKLSVLQSVIAGGQVWLALFAVLFSLIGTFYYLRVVKLMYFDDAADTSPITASADVRVVLSLNGLAVLVLGLMPGGLMTACMNAIVKTLAS
ncbi:MULTISPECIES: NADH-quinone oxidoreductase subunit NuoN [unclassified Undibacterium]|uniref:NADH-quinone oxidoreductase subunit NuoN n=1 Tax=unclassified Undibacterium TaxID=2630295 RepID=UPI002AC938E5|nr:MULTISPECIES: NADH-quinone oxidoreductase subunit NuoN [unclassified Undibacterium]MEB0139618.1 NADH-quinone oxidoreductase subunit NuoN [Undibacterium sp. CCC2.1]MEB0171974.1 NADH-quinone oxidoreductase subunit NuoN [Undibacterium sp. CCC1.1]MEB0176287.1 NADH-quinone oxidoreductase subunit NuoN [Undibacterium sp. CCC3.4]MEB0213969.1 NADH-quinone oxidoreductase subunit NuoN [Undibacterium sp. 5I2]WPX43585.1 NADH-quinone oxidoreductase subunit NuoN [Undibacterium sp. CCC3.4]